jgi:hypothetical protein
VRSSLLAILIFAGGSAPRDPLDTVQVWSTTVQQVSDAFCRGEVSADYLRETIGEARREIDHVHAELTSRHRERAAGEAADARDTLDRLTRRLAANDRDAACSTAEELDAPQVAMR